MAERFDTGELISETVRNQLGEGAIPLSACVVVSYLDPEGLRLLYCAWDDQSAFFEREGMVRNLLRDVTAVMKESTRQRAAKVIEEGGEYGDD